MIAALTGGCAGRSHLWTGPLGTLGADVPVRIEARVQGGTADLQPEPRLGGAIARAARTYLSRAPRGFRADCSGFVEAIFARAGASHVAGNTRQLWNVSVAHGWVHRRRRPQVGDLVFFDDTWDRNGNGRNDDDLTHIAVVIAVDDDATITMAHHGSTGGRTTLRMNLLRPDARRDGDRVINEALRRAPKSGRAVPTLASELWRGFATPTLDRVAEADNVADAL